MVNVHEVRHEYEKQSQVRAALAEELAVLRQVEEFASKGVSPLRGKNGFSSSSSLSPDARSLRIYSLENMLSISSNSLVSMASQLSEAEERDVLFLYVDVGISFVQWLMQKNFSNICSNSLVDARCQSWEKDIEIKDMGEQLEELVGLLRQSELRRKEAENELKIREQQTVAIALASSTPGDMWRPFYSNAASLTSYQRKSSISLGEFAPQLALLSLSEVSMPGLEKQITFF